jgi:hypothetical protein
VDPPSHRYGATREFFANKTAGSCDPAAVS